MLLWDLEMDEIVVPLRRAPGGSPTISTGSQSAHWDHITPIGILQPAPTILDIPKISPLITHRVHADPLSGILFSRESILTVCREGNTKVWMRPGAAAAAESQSVTSETMLGASLKDKFFSSR